MSTAVSLQYKNPVIQKPVEEHFRIHRERAFLASERASTTVLFGGLSPTHDYLIEATLKALDVHAQRITPTKLEAFHTGREYCNNGYCNPSYFTVGNLINYLKDLEHSGISKEDIIEHYVFLTAGCNAPCRFGMLETEYRMALQDSGFDGFRILVFQNEGGLNQSSNSNGLEVTPEFFLALVNAINLADVINEIVYATRPYEIVKGQTEEVRQKALDYLYELLKNKKKIKLSGWRKSIFKKLGIVNSINFIYLFIDQISSSYYTNALKEVRKMFEQVKVDRFRSKTTVKITGEFWAMTTVGAGNFNMFKYLESEGAVLLIEPVASLIQFLLSKGLLRHSNRREMSMKDGVEHWWYLRKRLANYVEYQKKYLRLKLGYKLFRREFARLQDALGAEHHMLIEQPLLQQLAKKYYNINIEGGEGYMEIAKNLYYHKQHLAHMVLSLKPFGCMPSTQSDGVQSAILELDRNMIFLPIETAAEGETNAQSRVLMSLSDAKLKAKKEIAEALNSVSFSIEDMKAYVKSHPELEKATYVVPHHHGVVSSSASFIYHVDDLMRREKKQSRK